MYDKKKRDIADNASTAAIETEVPIVYQLMLSMTENKSVYNSKVLAKIKVSNNNVTALVDTGSTMTLIDKKCTKCIGLKLQLL